MNNEENRVNLLDAEILDKAIDGDQKAITNLMERYQKPILSYIKTYIKSQEDAEDLCQECFNKAFKNLKSYNPEYAFSTWLFNIAQHICIDYYRKRKLNLVPLSDGESKNEKESWSTSVPSPEETIISEQTVEKLIRSIDALDKIYRDAAILRFIKEYAYEEIAKELDIPLNTVKTRVKRAKDLILKRWKN
jgi:RNA polymerase sigma-70 factor (ECF subfamily)